MSRLRLILAIAISAAASLAAEQGGKAAALAAELKGAGLDPDACFRVRDLAFQKEDLRFYLTEGYLIFSKPVGGHRFGAMFTADVPGGDAEVLLFPPLRSERMSLAHFAKSPNLNEHFVAALFLFSYGTGDELLNKIESGAPKRLPEIGTSMASNYGETLRNLVSSFDMRLVQDYFTSKPERTGFLYAGISTRNLGAVDLIYDQRQRDQIVVGQVATRLERRFFDTWSSFPAQSFRKGERKALPPNVHLDDVNINASLTGPELHLQATTAMDVTARTDGDLAVPFEIASAVKVTSVKVDGVAAEMFRGESFRTNLMRNTGGTNELFLVMMPKPLASGEKHRIEFTHEGNVVQPAGNGVYFVGARLNWYPNRDAEFSRYEMTFRYPRNLRLVATGDIHEEHLDGDTKVVHYTASSPIRFAGFNLGDYQSIKTTRAGVVLEVCANRKIESALTPRKEVVLPPPSNLPPGRPSRRNNNNNESVIAAVPPPANPLSRLEQLTNDIGSALDFLVTRLGPPPLKTLTVSPIPGTFGQGFPGLIYISTLAYLNPSDRPMPLQTEANRLFFSELLHDHETAHQWWGNLVTSASYQDDWLMEALANYSALMALEKRKGRKTLEYVLDEYRQDLLKKDKEGEIIESAGPLIWGSRLQSSRDAAAWRPVVYEKGTWVVHMLRERMGDENFFKMLGEVVRQKRYAALTTEDFRTIAARFMPPKSEDASLENFFDSWVYNTGIPAVKVQWSVQGRAPKVQLKGTVTQSDVSDDFTTAVPIDIMLPTRKVVRHWVQTSGETTSFTIALPAPPAKVNADPAGAMLARR